MTPNEPTNEPTPETVLRSDDKLTLVLPRWVLGRIASILSLGAQAEERLIDEDPENVCWTAPDGYVRCTPEEAKAHTETAVELYWQGVGELGLMPFARVLQCPGAEQTYAEACEHEAQQQAARRSQEEEEEAGFVTLAALLGLDDADDEDEDDEEGPF